MMKLSDYVFRFLKEKGVGHVFMLPGGGAMHLDDSLGRSGIEYVCFMHEQAAAVAAEAYGQHTGQIGVCLTTSGPGATNAITGVTAGWIDSTPVFVISGQAKRSDLIGKSGVRQMGSQEVQIIDMVKPVTKYAVQILDPSEIRYHLERAYFEALHGRPGPVWISIPLDVQAAEINEDRLEGYLPKKSVPPDLTEVIATTMRLLAKAEKPLLLAGNGIRLAGAVDDFRRLVKDLKIPVETTWKAADMMAEDDPLYLGHPGIMGDRGANLALQSADVLICIGSRLDASITAFNEPHFGMSAKKVIVDIDQHELDRMHIAKTQAKAACDAGEYIREWMRAAAADKSVLKNQPLWEAWTAKGKALRKKYPVVTKEHKAKKGYVSAYYFIGLLCRYLTADDVIVPESSGAAGEITYQAFAIKYGQKMKNAAGLGSMGFGLPYAIGSCLANHGKRTVLINGDGAFQLNIQELQTLVRLRLPVKIFIWNNKGYASIRSMQNSLFEGRYVASGETSGLSMPDLCKVAEAYGIRTLKIQDNQELETRMSEIFADDELILCELNVSQEDTVSPRTKTIRKEDGTLISSELEHMWPFIEESGKDRQM